LFLNEKARVKNSIKGTWFCCGDQIIQIQLLIYLNTIICRIILSLSTCADEPIAIMNTAILKHLLTIAMADG
jgi:hypothetical protein